MIITATDFQLSVNEYFTKLIQGEDVVIERYGSKFAVLVSYEKYLEMVGKGKEKQELQSTGKADDEEVPSREVSDSLSADETVKLVKSLLSQKN